MDRPPLHELSAVNGHSLRFKYRATPDAKRLGTTSRMPILHGLKRRMKSKMALTFRLGQPVAQILVVSLKAPSCPCLREANPAPTSRKPSDPKALRFPVALGQPRRVRRTGAGARPLRLGAVAFTQWNQIDLLLLSRSTNGRARGRRTRSPFAHERKSAMSSPIELGEIRGTSGAGLDVSATPGKSRGLA